MRNLMTTLTWAYAILVGAWLLTPEGPVPIVTNIALARIVGVIGLGLGAYNLVQQFNAKKSTA